MIFISLNIHQQDKELFCELIFYNNTSDSFYLNKIDIGGFNEVMSNIFSIKRREEIIPYEGVLMKRGVAIEEDFLLLAPKENVRTKARIDNVYNFPKGNNKYTIKYSYYHSSPEEEPELHKLESEMFHFFYDNR